MATRYASRHSAANAVNDRGCGSGSIRRPQMTKITAADSTQIRRQTSTTLSDPQLTKPLFGLLHPLHVSRATGKQQPGKDFLDERPSLREGERRSGTTARSRRHTTSASHGACMMKC